MIDTVVERLKADIEKDEVVEIQNTNVVNLSSPASSDS